MEHELLKFENVSYGLQGKRILSSLNWSVKKGEHWAVIGPNGAGKSTLLKLIYGFIWPNSSGIIYRKGDRNNNFSELRKSIGLVAGNLLQHIPVQETALQTVLSGKDAMLGYWAFSHSRSDKADHQKASDLMEDFGVLKFKDRKTKTLSHGETQKVMLARALMSEPYLILLDEPLDGFDPGAQESFLDTLEQYISRNNEPSFIYVTHHIGEIIDGLNKVLILKDGEILYKGDTVKGLSSEQISALYDYPFDLLTENGRYRIIKRNKRNLG